VGVVPGQVLLGKYRVDAILGHGGMGVVAKCTHLIMGGAVAIKMLRKDVLHDRDSVERFTREAKAAHQLRSEYVARVLDVGTFEDGVPYMVMEYLDGQDLGQLLEQQGCVGAPLATQMMLQTAEALAEAHSVGIVHRDVKPTNLFYTWRPDGSALIKVLDFGISKSPTGTDLQLTQTQSLLGTPAYMSPEQMRSARLVDARTDIWSLGTVIYELIEGRRPFEAESFSEMCVKVAVDPPAPFVNTPPSLQPVLLRCLAKSPDQRYTTMAELSRDLIPFAPDESQAKMLVERMVRMLRRSSGADWDVQTGSASRSLPMPMAMPAGTQPYVATPPHGVPNALQARAPSAPVMMVRAPSPQHDVNTLKDPPRKRSKLGFVLGASFVVIAIAIGVLLINNDDSAATKVPPPPTVKMEEKPAPPTPPLPVKADAVKPDDVKADDAKTDAVAVKPDKPEKPFDKATDKITPTAGQTGQSKPTGKPRPPHTQPAKGFTADAKPKPEKPPEVKTEKPPDKKSDGFDPYANVRPPSANGGGSK
jgi:eukaryotic-like serine/threonine-protein kinase